ncbi:TIGR00730 family Rossman fold protein [Sphingomonas echinoides]|uniref:AMP nucleosidase n=1 Tax=Sphingomonas echinoides TaxID=59803 RepID=A0ABU4PJJ0_9SPHN|nr:TIGR00730 family Rossman fold protein [Sphingomonas echinoides]MDX5983604.1 TIGR00730 family Rossman fold protein [Sphingomonas echinoides]
MNDTQKPDAPAQDSLVHESDARDTHVPSRVFPRARQDAETAKTGVSTPQTENPAYRLAFQDMDFLLREDLRPVRFQLELLKPQLIMDEANIASTFVMYGSARIPEPAKAQALLDIAHAAEGDREQAIRIAERLVAKSKYYEVARELGRLASSFPVDTDGKRHFVVCSGGGPSIMEAANRGAADCGHESIGLNIVLPHEQAPNPYVTPALSMQFHYFALRKMHFLLHARALAAFPGGFGTFDELFELLTLIQTGKIAPIPVLLYGREFWNRVVNFDALVEEGVVSAKDLKIFTFVETAQEGWDVVKAFYRDKA